MRQRIGMDHYFGGIVDGATIPHKHLICSKICSMAANTWSAYYKANERNRGFSSSTMGEEQTVDPHSFCTINSGNKANMLMIPTGTADIVQFIHQISVATSKHLIGGTEISMFLHGNLSESQFKALGVVATVSSMYPANLVRTRVTEVLQPPHHDPGGL
jgi:hypothetical protein